MDRAEYVFEKLAQKPGTKAAKTVAKLIRNGFSEEEAVAHAAKKYRLSEGTVKTYMSGGIANAAETSGQKSSYFGNLKDKVRKYFSDKETARLNDKVTIEPNAPDKAQTFAVDLKNKVKGLFTKKPKIEGQSSVDPVDFIEQGMKLTKNDTLSKADDVVNAATSTATNVAGAAEDGTQATKKVVDYEKLYKDTNKKRIQYKNENAEYEGKLRDQRVEVLKGLGREEKLNSEIDRQKNLIEMAYGQADDYYQDLQATKDKLLDVNAKADKMKNLAIKSSIAGGAAGTVGLGVGAYGLLSNRDKVKKSA